MLIVLRVAVLVGVACNGDGDADPEDLAAINFTFAPDPAWDWIRDQGILEEMEAEAGMMMSSAA